MTETHPQWGGGEEGPVCQQSSSSLPPSRLHVWTSPPPAAPCGSSPHPPRNHGNAQRNASVRHPPGGGTPRLQWDRAHFRLHLPQCTATPQLTLHLPQCNNVKRTTGEPRAHSWLAQSCSTDTLSLESVINQISGWWCHHAVTWAPPQPLLKRLHAAHTAMLWAAPQTDPPQVLLRQEWREQGGEAEGELMEVLPTLHHQLTWGGAGGERREEEGRRGDRRGEMTGEERGGGRKREGERRDDRRGERRREEERREERGRGGRSWTGTRHQFGAVYSQWY